MDANMQSQSLNMVDSFDRENNDVHMSSPREENEYAVSGPQVAQQEETTLVNLHWKYEWTPPTVEPGKREDTVLPSVLPVTSYSSSYRITSNKLYQSIAHRIVATRPVAGGSMRGSSSAYQGKSMRIPTRVHKAQQIRRTTTSLYKPQSMMSPQFTIKISAYDEEEN